MPWPSDVSPSIAPGHHSHFAIALAKMQLKFSNALASVCLRYP